MARTTRPTHSRALWDRTNHANRGFKDNTPAAWVDTNGPVWWVGSDQARAYLAPASATAGRSAITRAANLIVGRLAACPWEVAGGTPRWVTDPMLTRPDARFPMPVWPAGQRVGRSLFWGTWIRCALLWGMGWVIFTEDSQGQ